VAAVAPDTPDDSPAGSASTECALLAEADADELVTLRLRDYPLAIEAEDVLDITGSWQTHPTRCRQLVVHAARTANP
jgi:hypothetical protein